MTLLVFRDPNSTSLEKEFDDDIRLGTAADNDFKLPEGLGIAAYHAVISRSKLYGVSVLVDLAGDKTKTKVNGYSVVKISTLRHRDRIELGQAKLEFWEMTVNRLKSNSHLIGKTCQVCYENFAPDEKLIICPRCQAPHHQDCWFQIPICSRYGCGYPVRESMQRSLATYVRFEELDEDSDLVKQQRLCMAENPRDEAPFKAGNSIAKCPNCQTPFHTPCFFGLQNCPNCNYDVASLMQSVFNPKQLYPILIII
ncbi:RING finger protein [Nostoc sp. DedQUE07]|uniref:RING finger protein n=1 Tax=Nostoc sp. DedQUE07 TaxID=3075392 RepID=UPI00391CCCED